MKFRYIPKPGDPETTTVFGIEFTKGEVVEVNDNAVVQYKRNMVSVIDKLKGNASFEEVKAAAPRSIPNKTAAKTTASTADDE